MFVVHGKIHWVLDESDKVSNNSRDPRTLFEFADKGIAYISRAWPKQGPTVGDRISVVPNNFEEGDVLAAKMHDFIILGLSKNTFIVLHAPLGMNMFCYWDKIREFKCTDKAIQEGLKTEYIETKVVSPFLEHVNKLVVN